MIKPQTVATLALTARRRSNHSARSHFSCIVAIRGTVPVHFTDTDSRVADPDPDPVKQMIADGGQIALFFCCWHFHSFLKKGKKISQLLNTGIIKIASIECRFLSLGIRIRSYKHAGSESGSATWSIRYAIQLLVNITTQDIFIFRIK